MSAELFLSREQVRAFDQFAIEQLGIPAAVLMENAGRGAAQILYSLGIQGPVVISSGKGNNGGDGLVMARHLANWGVGVHLLLLARPEDLTGDAALQWNITQKMGLPSQVIADVEKQADILSSAFASADWIVDALFGTGLAGAVRAPLDRIIESINARGVRVLAVDIPSGLDCDGGAPLGAAIRAQHTVTFVAPKLGFRNPASLEFTGRVHVADIGIAPAFRRGGSPKP
jgi:NAD(P)H-hydrate epimerase